MFMIIRTDDNGNNFLVIDNLSEIECNDLLSRIIGYHKQHYFKVEYFNRLEIFQKYQIVE